MHLDPFVALAGLVVGFTVGLTGMGGGALMTPILVLIFGVQPLAAVSSDLVASFFMKPIGGAVHLRRGTVNKRLVGWLVLGSVPMAFAGVLVLRLLGSGTVMQDKLRYGLGGALLLASASMAAKSFMGMRQASHDRRQGITRPPSSELEVRVRPIPTLCIGAVGGLIVGMTSVGSGSLIIVLLLLLYPQLRASQLVGTDLVQAVPLVASASLGHVLFGDLKLGLTGALLLGAIPGVYLGARVSSQAPGWLVRRALVAVLMLSGLKLVNVSTMTLGAVLLFGVLVVPIAWRGIRVLHGLPPRVPARPTTPSKAAALHS